MTRPCKEKFRRAGPTSWRKTPLSLGRSMVALTSICFWWETCGHIRLPRLFYGTYYFPNWQWSNM